MQVKRSKLARAGFALLMVGCGLVGTGLVSAQLPMEVIRETGSSITPAYEGWYKDRDGTRRILIGYYNRNTKETIDIPIGPNNRIEPGGPDMGQPTHFTPRRGWGVFTITPPADFGDKKYTWTIVANGKTMSIPFGFVQAYEVEPFKDAGMGNTPPTLKFTPDGTTFTGPPVVLAATLNATVGTPLTLDVWAGDDGHEEPGDIPRPGVSPLTVTWNIHRTPDGGMVKFGELKPKVDTAAAGKATTTATFSMPGEYMLRAQSNDTSGEGGAGFQCCWTNAHVKVIVK